MVSSKVASEYFQKHKKFHPEIVEEENRKAQDRMRNVKVWSEPDPDPDPEPEPAPAPAPDKKVPDKNV